MSTDPIYLEKDGELAWLVLNRPGKHNAMSQRMWGAIPSLVGDAEADPAIKVLILRGEGGEAFSAGADISEFKEANADRDRRHQNRIVLADAMRALHTARKPILSMIQGLCIGGGSAMAVATDMRFATPDSRFGITPARIGLAYSLEEVRHLLQLVGPSVTKTMLFTGRHMDAEEALRVGLIDEIADPHEIAEKTRAFAGLICQNSQYSVRAIKRIINLALEGHPTELEESWQLVLDAYDGEDYEEGVSAFIEKRRPDFTFR